MKTRFLFIVAALLSAAVIARDEEPDGLSWELYSQDRSALLHFYAWAKANPPPIQTSQTSQTSQTVPYVWVKPSDLPFETDSTNMWKYGEWKGERVLCGHELSCYEHCYQTFEVPEDGVYRFWIRYAHTKGWNETNRFRLMRALDEEHPEEDDGSAYFALFEQTFARANLFPKYVRELDPIPQISAVETPADGFYWEATRKMAFLKKGRYTVRHQAAVIPNRGKLQLANYFLVADPFITPGSQKRAKGESGRMEASAQFRDPLYAIRPGGMENPPPELRSWWMQWRKAFFARLLNEEHGKDYVWGNLAGLVTFGENQNAIDRVSQLIALGRKDAQPSDVYKVDGDAFELDGNWKPDHGDFDAVRTAHAVKCGGVPGAVATKTIDVKRSGSYHLWACAYMPHILAGYDRGAMRVTVSAGGKALKSFVIGREDGVIQSDAEHDGDDGDAGGTKAMGFNQVRSNRKDVWSDSGAFELPAGKVELKVETVRPPWAPGSKKIWRVLFARAVLTERNDFIPDLEQEYPWGDRVGMGDVGFWVAKDPWCAFSRFSLAAEGKYFSRNGEKAYRSYVWTPVADGEVDRGEHQLEAMRGEVISQLVVVRNNTDRPIRFTPAFTGDLSARCRVVAWSPVYEDGEWIPRFLLERKVITLPARQNTGLWVNIDCRGAKEGVHPVRLSFAGKEHVWNVNVKRSIEGKPNPWLYPWAQPSCRESCCELWKELGITMIQSDVSRPTELLSKRAFERFGFRKIRMTAPRSIKGSDVRVDQDRVRWDAAQCRKLGLSYDDWCYEITDEPGFRSMTNWVKVARLVREADPKARFWCNTGYFPSDREWPDTEEFRGYWDVFCPFHHAFIEREGRNAEHLKAFRQIGNPRLGYITPSTTLYWIADGGHELFDFARICREEGRDGWGVCRFMSGGSWDLVYQDLRCVFDGAWGGTISTRYAEAIREANQRWRKAGPYERISLEVRKADEAATRAWFRLKDKADFDAHRAALKAKLLEAIGPLPERTPLNARTVGTVMRKSYVVEKVRFESRPGQIVTANLFLPTGPKVKKPCPAVVISCGHANEGKAYAGYQRACVQLVEAGLAALIFDPVGQGERWEGPGTPRGTICHNLLGDKAFAAGSSMTAIRLWDAMRAIDYVQSRPEVDAEKIGFMGQSGGGTMTAFVEALDPRVKVAAPSGYISSIPKVYEALGPQDAEQNPFGALRDGINHLSLILMGDIPTLVCACRDDMFPYEGTVRTVEDARAVARLLHMNENRWRIVSADGPHGWKESTREASVRWMVTWLRNVPYLPRDSREVDGAFDPAKVDMGLSPEEAQVTKTGFTKDEPGYRPPESFLGPAKPRKIVATGPSDLGPDGKVEGTGRHVFYGNADLSCELDRMLFSLGETLEARREVDRRKGAK